MSRRIENIKKLSHLVKLGVLVTMLAGCSSLSTLETVEGDDIAHAPELTGDLLYNLLAGEFAGIKGDMSKSTDYYRDAAENTLDPQVAERAVHIALYAKRYDDVLELSERWLKLGGDKKAIARSRALAYLHLSKIDNAVENIEQLLLVDGKIDKKSVAALGHILQQEASSEIALSVLALLNTRHPQQANLLLIQARFESNAADYKKAMNTVEQVIQLAPEISDSYLIKAQILAAENKEKEALASIAIAVEKRAEDNRLRLQYARMLVRVKMYDEAWTHFLRLKQALPDNENILLSLGLLSIETGKTDLAKQYLQELIDKGHHNFQAHYYLGRIQQNNKEYMAAIANYERVTSGEYLLDARIRVAGLLAEVGKIDDALAKLKALIKQDNNINQIKVYLAQGEVLRRVQRNKEAMTVYNAALKDSPENVDLLYARALTAEKLDMLDVTESDLRMVLIHEPNNANALNALGYTLADRTERLEEAKKYILKAASLLPDDPAVLDSLGWIYYRLGEYAKAIDWLSKAFAKLEDAEIAAHLGEVLWKNGQIEEANKIWQRGLKVEADHPVLKKTIKQYLK